MTVLMASDEITGLIARMQERVKTHQAECEAREQQIETDRQERLALLRQVAELLKPVQGMPMRINYLDGTLSIRIDDAYPPRLMVQVLDVAGMPARCLAQYECERRKSGELVILRTWIMGTAGESNTPLTVGKAALTALREINECLP